MSVLILGESCVDLFVYGNCDRIAPDAPVPVLVPLFEKSNPGMAGNTFENLKSLGTDCDLVTNTKQVIKKRYVDQRTNHMIMRVDEGDEGGERIPNIQDISFQDYDAVVISDYDKGFLQIEDLQYIFSNSNLTFMDTKKIVGKWALDCDYIKVNEFEYRKTMKINPQDVPALKDKLIITLGGKGCTHKEKLYGVNEVPVKDNCGAGDTFLAGLVSSYLEDKDIGKAIEFANECASQVVQLRGVNTVEKVKNDRR